MKLEFKDIINKEADKQAIVMGLGPSLSAHTQTIKSLTQKDDFILIGCNDVDLLVGIDVDYWVWANSQDTITLTHKRLSAKKATVVYADSVDRTSPKEADSLLSGINYLPYDQRHFNCNPCGSPGCCKNIIAGRKTIQEEFQTYTGYHKYSTSSDTVAIHMLYLSVLLGCKTIFVTGVDLDYSRGYVNNANAQVASQEIARVTDVRQRILDTVRVINASAKAIGANIYCIDQDLHISQVLEYSELPNPT